MFSTVRLLLLATASILSASTLVQAEASAWSEDMKSAVRLISGNTASTPMQAGVEIKLASGWHTYWRYPGDSGVPPQFDFSRSDNLKSAAVLFPAPQLHKDASGETIVYETDVIFPVEVTAKDASRPVKLRLSFGYAVCENMCIPAKAEAEFTLHPKKGAADARLDAAFARVPKKETAAEAGLTLKRDGGRVVLTLPAADDTPASVFVEGPTKDWALPIPKPLPEAPAGKRAFSFKLDGQPPGADVSKPIDLTFTVVQGARAFEVTTRLD